MLVPGGFQPCGFGLPAFIDKAAIIVKRIMVVHLCAGLRVEAFDLCDLAVDGVRLWIRAD